MTNDGPWLPCPKCGGSGESHYFIDGNCHWCKGEGRIPEYDEPEEESNDE